MTPLHHTLGLGKSSGSLSMVGRRHEKDLGTDLFCFELAGRDFRAFFPPGGRFDELEVTDHYPLKIGHSHTLHTSIGRSHSRILAQYKVTIDTFIKHPHQRLIGTVGTG